jgi:isopentenyl-diphosphate delta-isomerase
VREYVVVVDHANHALGAVEKLQAHRQPVLHRAVSVLLFHPNGALLLQRRAAGKYHSPLRWSNTCCGHPLPGESSRRAAARRLQAEMGITAPLHAADLLEYRLDLGDGLHEHELNQVWVGEWSGTPAPNPAEVAEWHWLTPSLVRSLCRDDARVTRWLCPVLSSLSNWARTATVLPTGVAAWHRDWVAQAA